jgi:hypothetical protein
MGKSAVEVYFKGLFRIRLQGLKKVANNFQSVYPVFLLRFESFTSKILVRIIINRDSVLGNAWKRIPCLEKR